MVYSIKFLPRAQAELEEALTFCQENAVPSKKEFLKELGEFIKRLKINPFQYHFKNKQFRQFALKKFTYLIIFEIIESEREVLICALLKQKNSLNIKF